MKTTLESLIWQIAFKWSAIGLYTDVCYTDNSHMTFYNNFLTNITINLNVS